MGSTKLPNLPIPPAPPGVKTPLPNVPAAEVLRPTAPIVRSPARLGPGLEIKGEISGNEDLQIDGKLEGSISLGGHRLTVGGGAHVTAEVVAREAVIYGEVKGNIRARDRIDIKKDGSVVGDLVTTRISIEDGAYFKGHIEIDRGGGQVGGDLDSLLSRTSSKKS